MVSFSLLLIAAVLFGRCDADMGCMSCGEVPTPKPTSKPEPEPTPSPTVKVSEWTKPTPSPTRKQEPQTVPTPTPTKKEKKPTASPTKKEEMPTPSPTREDSRPTPSPTRRQPRPTPSPTRRRTKKPTSSPTKRRTRKPTPKPTPEPTTLKVLDLCMNQLLDEANDETDVDCGGSFCETRCRLGQQCLQNSDCSAILLCNFTNAAGNKGICDFAPPPVPPPSVASCDSSKTSCGREWTPLAIVATLMLATCIGTGIVLNNDFLVFESFELGQTIATLGAFFALPVEPLVFQNFASTLSWTAFIFLDIGSVSHNDSPSEGGEGSRLLQNFVDEEGEAILGIDKLASIIGVEIEKLLLNCIVGVLVVYVAYCFIRLLFLRSASEGRREITKEASVRIPFYALFPVTALTAFSVFILVDSNSERENFEGKMSFLLSFLIVLTLGVYATWFFSCIRFGGSKETSTFRAIRADWREGYEKFWIARSCSSVIKGIVLGMLTSPLPIQASVFLVLAFAYFLAVIILRPYKLQIANFVASCIAFLQIISTSISVVLTARMDDLSLERANKLGKAQLAFSMICIIGMLCLAIVQAIAKQHEKKDPMVQADPGEQSAIEKPANAEEEAVAGSSLLEQLTRVMETPEVVAEEKKRVSQRSGNLRRTESVEQGPEDCIIVQL